MKTYIDYNQIIGFENTLTPKNLANTDYVRILKQIKSGEAELIPYTPPAPTWEEIKNKRNLLLTQSDWTDLPNTPITNKQAWLDYRQALRDIPQDFTNPEDVVWPVKPS